MNTKEEILFSFYKLRYNPILQTLFHLLRKTNERKLKAHIVVQDNHHANNLCNNLWQCHENTEFLPIGTIDDGNLLNHNTTISSDIISDNNAEYLFLLGYGEYDNLKELYHTYQRVIVLFESEIKLQLEWGRTFWMACRDQYCQCEYWQQDKKKVG